MQYDYESTETVYAQDGEGTNIMTNNVIGDDNHVQQSPFPWSEYYDQETETEKEIWEQ